jgi:hypothetical protein
MNYKKHYELLISRGKNRVLEGYVEKHHIVPQCMGGGDERENLVQLTPEEHYVAHQLLLKMYPNIWGLSHATQLMTTHHTDSRTTNKLFGWIRRRCALSMSETMKRWQKENGHPRGMAGKEHSDVTKKQIANSAKASKIESVGVKVYAYNLDGSFYKEFRTLTECAEYLKTSPSNVKYTAEGKFQHCSGKQLRYQYVESLPAYINPNKIRSKEKVICIHCGKEGSGPVMNRFHFENCKHKNKELQ